MISFKNICLLFCLVYGQVAVSQTGLLDQYIQQAIARHPSLQQQTHLLEKSKLQLQGAKTLHLPTVNFNSTYSTAVGGRSISFPVGDLINPIYSTLNFLTPAQFPKFPENAVPNVNEQLVPKNFYDMRIKTQMPLYNQEIKYNEKIKSQLVDLQRVDIDIFKRELAKDVKTAYFNYLKTLDALQIYEAGKNLLKETERVNRSLIKNEMAGAIVLSRTLNEQAKLDAEAINAENNWKNAQAYFNYLLNKPLQSDITVDSSYRQLPLFESAAAPLQREELKKIAAGQQVNQTMLQLNKAYRKPKIGAILDLGSQGSIKDINAKNPFALFGLSVDLPIYAAGRNKLKIMEQEQELLALAAQEQQVTNQLSLQQEMAKNSLQAALNSMSAKNSAVATALKYYTDLSRRYKEGQANYVELFEAQTQLINARLQKSLAGYDAWIRHAELERAMAQYSFSN